MPDHRPLTRMESREVHPIRLKPSEVDLLKEKAQARGIGWTTFARECLLMGLSLAEAQEHMKAYTRITA